MEEIRPIRDESEARTCAAMMASSDPWLILGRGFDGCLGAVTDPTCETYVAVDGDVVRGVLIINMRGAFVGYIRAVCVAADARSRGIGRRLVTFAEERIFRESPNAFLCVSSFNSRARALYERLGYVLVGEMRDYIVRGESELLMRKSIAPLKEFADKLSSRA